MLIKNGCMVLLMALAVGCSSVTHIETKAGPDALQKIAAGAEADYSVNWINDNTLEISDWWPTHSILSLDYTTFHANLQYIDGLLKGDYYLQSNQLFALFIRIRLDAQSSFAGGALKPYMRSEIDELLGFAGSSMAASKVTHSAEMTVGVSGAHHEAEPAASLD